MFDRFKDRHLSQATSTAIDTRPTRAAPGWMSPSSRPNSENVFASSGCRNAMSPSGSGSWPRAWGICFRIRITPIAAIRPLITLEGKKAAREPARASPSAICNRPAIITASRNAWNEPERGDLGRHDCRQAGGGAADARLRPAQGPHQNAADDPRHQPRDQWGV